MMKPPSRSEAQKIIRTLAEQGKIQWHPHAHGSMRKRKISALQVLNCLKKGTVDEEPTTNLSHKGWQTAVVGRAAGEWMRVVVCLRWKQDVLVITCY